MKPATAPSAQIHHTGGNHWIVSFQDDSSDTVWIADSILGSKTELSTSVQMQLIQIIGGKNINVSLLKVQQQNNCIDCGVFAIAFCTEFCFTGRKGVLNAEFDVVRMRQHLLTCLENVELVPFPKIRRKLQLTRKKQTSANYTVSVDCAALCGYPNSYDDMVQCDLKNCSNAASDSMLLVCEGCKCE